MIGTTISHFRILDLLGKGGMGVVYRAEDTTLNRQVAIKVLPELLAHDPERLARFEREAKLLATLNHPNIATIHGLEEADGKRLLILELVEGETLAERIKKGPIPVEEALHLALQITEGLEAAHEKGIIHRDLKPGNIKITPEGKIKILDFGLAKAFEEETPATDASHSPTLTDQMTHAGVILGTAAYMSPEQAKGKAADKRADIWAFGAVLFEMLSGRRAFEGETVTETLASVLKGGADWNDLPEGVPRGIRTLLRRSLTKNPHQRLHEIADARIEIEESLSQTGEDPPIPIPGAVQTGWKRVLPWSIAALMAVLAIVGWAWVGPADEPIRKLVTLPQSPLLNNPQENEVAISPDGRRVAYRSVDGLYLRSLDDFSAMPVAGAERLGFNPFFSPDGQWLAFFAEGQVKKVAVAGGTPITICRAEPGDRKGIWFEDTIFFSSNRQLFRVSSSGGDPEVLPVPDPDPDDRSYELSDVLPEGRQLLFTIWSPESRIASLSLDTGEKKILFHGFQARYAPTGHLVYGIEGGAPSSAILMAVPFDAKVLEMTGDPAPILQEGVRRGGGLGGWIDYTFSNDGTLLFVPAGPSDSQDRLVWVDREGAVEPVGTPTQHSYDSPRLSPEETRVVVNIPPDIWVYDLSLGTLSRLTFEGANAQPVWSPDGERIAFRSNRAGPFNLFWKLADGSGSTDRLTSNESRQNPMAFSPDGRFLAFHQQPPPGGASNTGRDIWVVATEGERQTQLFLQTQFSEAAPVFSPDGRWLAYISDESGRREIFVRPFPGPDPKRQISTDGGTEPVWGRSGELFFRNESGNQMMVVEITTEPVFRASAPRLLFEGNFRRGAGNRAFYDVSADGRRFLMVQPSGGPTDTGQINVVLNWFEELKRLVPTD